MLWRLSPTDTELWKQPAHEGEIRERGCFLEGRARWGNTVKGKWILKLALVNNFRSSGPWHTPILMWLSSHSAATEFRSRTQVAQNLGNLRSVRTSVHDVLFSTFHQASWRQKSLFHRDVLDRIWNHLLPLGSLWPETSGTVSRLSFRVCFSDGMVPTRSGEKETVRMSENGHGFPEESCGAIVKHRPIVEYMLSTCHQKMVTLPWLYV